MADESQAILVRYYRQEYLGRVAIKTAPERGLGTSQGSESPQDAFNRIHSHLSLGWSTFSTTVSDPDRG
jgi:hypothetical protein